MSVRFIIGAMSAVVLSVTAMQSHAALIGVLPATPEGSDWQAYYDDVETLTWVADAFLAGSSMTWDDASSWAASLNINGVTGWRLPTALNPDGSGPCYGDGCDGSELGNLFFNTLGNTVGTVGAAVNTGPFSNVVRSPFGGFSYWSSTIDPSDPLYAWHLDFSTGRQLEGPKDKLLCCMGCSVG